MFQGVIRKIIIASIVIFTLGLIAAGYYLQKVRKIEVIDPFLTVPADAVVIIETPDFPELLTKVNEKNGIAWRLKNMKWASSLVADASLIDSLTGNQEVREYMTGRRTIISFHSGPGGRLTPLVAMNIGAMVSRRHIEGMIESTGAIITEKGDVDGAKSIVARYGKGNDTRDIYFAFTAGVLIATPSMSLMANALNNKNSGSDIRLQQGFSKVAGAFGEESDNIFILFRNLPGFFKGIVDPAEINEIVGLAIAAGGEIDEKEDGLYINGFIATSGSGTGADRVMNITPATPGIQEILPATVRSFRTIMREVMLSGEPATDPVSINATDIALSLRPYTENEITLATLSTTAGNKNAILFRVSNKTAADSVLKERIAAKYKSLGIKSDSYIIKNGESGSGNDMPVYKMPFTGIASILSQGQKLTFSDSYAVFCRSYLIFSDDPAVLRSVTYASENGSTLINDPLYNEVEKSLPTKSSYLCYLSSDALCSEIQNVLVPEKASTFDMKSLSGIGAIGVSMTPSNNMVYISLSVAYSNSETERLKELISSAEPGRDSSSAETDNRLLWKAMLQAPPVIKPFVFINHTNNAREIFIQDASNNIYLISATGKILWSAHIRERIRGDVFMIDYYRNGKNQILFAGKEYLHLIDRNGKYVDKYPVRLKSPAANTLAVFDYESNKDYRLFISGEDKKVYTYDKSGSIVKGWTPLVTTQKVTSPVKYFRTGGKDYIVVHNTYDINILDRRGNKRVTVKKSAGVAENSAVRLTKASDIVFSDPDGGVHFLDFTGNEEMKSAGKMSPGLFFDYYDINRDGLGEIIVIDQGVLTICRDDMSVLATARLPEGKFLTPEIVSLTTGLGMVALTDENAGSLWLFDDDARIKSGFPLKGSVLPVIVRLTSSTGNTVITGGPDNYVYCYKLTNQ